MSLYESNSITTFSQSSRPSRPADQYADYGFIAVLALAQRLHVTFLPLTWQAALPELGRGGQAGVNQALINLQISFAFKRFGPPSTDSYGERTPFQEIVCEMIMLSHPSIRQHPYIVTLEGICWDIPGDGEQVFPVLVFQKSHFGDLHRFAKEGMGQDLSLEERRKLCADIGIAIRDMHSNNIIHGDIKPENVLIFKDEAQGYFAKVADFGFSSRFRGESDLILIPRSRPWDAPEYHSRGFSPQAAQKMDVYRFGLLCLWLLFGSSGQAPLAPWMAQENGHFISFKVKEDELSLVELLKSDENNALLKWATWLVKDSEHVKDDLKHNLNQFFDLILDYKPENRQLNLTDLLNLLAPARAIQEPTETFAIESVQKEEYFQIQTSFMEFIEADFRLRPFIATSLETIALKFPLPLIQHISPQNAAMQLALCYGVGFGVQKDDDKGKAILEESSQRDKSLEYEVRLIKDAVSWPPLQDGLYQRVFQEGHIPGIDFPQYYRERNLLERAEINYKREIKDFCKSFEASHEVCLRIKSRLASILYNQVRWEEAQALQVQVMEMSQKALGQKHLHTLASITDLATTFGAQGRWEEAEKLEVQAVEISQRVFGQEHPDTLRSIGNLAGTFREQGRWKEAEMLQVQVMEANQRVLGQEHPDTLKSISNLAETFKDQGQWKKAEGLEIQAIKISQKVLGQEHPDTLTGISGLAIIFRQQGRWKEAEKLDVQVIKISQRVLGQEHPDTLRSMTNLGTTFGEQGRWWKAEKLQLQIMEISQRVLGQEHPDTLRSIGNLAGTFWNQGRLKKAEKLDMQIIEISQRVLGLEHPDTLTNMANLAATFRDQRRWKEAEKLEVQVMEISQRVLGQEHPDTLRSIGNLAGTFREQGRWRKAEKLQVQVMEASQRVLGQEHPDTLRSMANLASTWRSQGRKDEARKMMSTCINLSVDKLGADHPDTQDRTRAFNM